MALFALTRATVLGEVDGGGFHVQSVPDGAMRETVRTLADLNGDGYPELVNGSESYVYTPSAVEVKINNGDGSFQQQPASFLIGVKASSVCIRHGCLDSTG
jgi:hypothetical protein